MKPIEPVAASNIASLGPLKPVPSGTIYPLRQQVEHTCGITGVSAARSRSSLERVKSLCRNEESRPVRR